jgi:DNA mismatch repair protein MutL
MAQKIIRLTQTVINQIAAGEVVENPASIVKELIENSLDAGAKRIGVRIQGGGGQLIEIEDDGCGMSAEDALLCLERHATSKIRLADDLHSLMTMGFRGEALAAIAAVSHFELKTSEGGVGTHILAEGGIIGAVSPVARNRGTSIAVRSLFFNVPARRKFQKSAAANAAQVARVVETIAIAHSEVAFSLHSHKEKLLDLEAGVQKQRVEAILGPFAHELRAPSIWGWLSEPSKAMSQRRGQMLFINRRPVFCPLVSRAVQVGYGTRLASNAYPPFVLFLEIDPKEVDVNVHPQKKEVRLSGESALFQKIETAVAETFAPPSFDAPLSFDSFRLAEESFPSFPRMAEIPLDLPFEIDERPLTVVGDYLLIEKEGVTVVDLRAAHARVLFDALKEEKKESEPLLWPLEISIEDPDDAAQLEKMGIECRSIGPKRLAIDALPQGLEAAHFVSFFAAWKEGKKIDAATVRYCRGLTKRYSVGEAFLLWRRLQKCPDSLYDPSGKRIWKKMDFDLWMTRG